MLKRVAYASLLGAALLGSAAFGQSTGDGNPDRSASGPTDPTQSAPTGNDLFVRQQATNQWRAPKLVGVGVYGPDDKKIGFIEDVLIDHDGGVQLVVIGVGGFLGLGTKEVAVPFKALQWRTEARAVPTTSPPRVNPPGSMNEPNARPTFAMTDPAATEASQGYPDKALLNVTAEQLKAAPSFQYVLSPLAELDTQPPAADGDARPQHP
jgi:hypothetical protein